MADLSSMSTDELISQLKAAKSSAPAASKSLSDMSTDELISLLRKANPPEMTVGRTAGLTARALGKGAGDAVFGLPALAADAAYNAVQGTRRLVGDKSAEFGMPVSSGLQSGLNTLADTVGLPKPETPMERIASTTGEAAVSVLNPVKLGLRALTTAPKILPKAIEFAKDIKNGITSAPTVAGGIAGGVGSTLNEYNPDHPYLNFALGLLAGPGAMLAGKYGRNVFRRDFNPDEPLNVASNRTLADEFNVPLTRDQLTQNIEDRALMDKMRWGAKGKDATQIVKNFDDAQTAQLNNAQRDLISNISGSPTSRDPSQIGQAMRDSFLRERDAARNNKNEMYRRAFDPEELAQRNIPFNLNREQFGAISGRVRSSLINRNDPVTINERLTPNAMEALDIVDGFSRGELPIPVNTRNAPQGFQRVTMNWRAVDQARKYLQPLRDAAYKADPSGADYRAMREIINSFDRSLAQGFPENIRLPNGQSATIPALPTNTLLSEAIANNAQYKSTFSPQSRNSVTNNIIKDLQNPDVNGTQVFNKVFGTSFNKGEAEHLVTQLNRIYANNPEGLTALREGGLRKLFLDANGETLSNGKISTNIENALGKQGNIYQALYTPDQLDRLRRFAQLSENISESRKRINGSGTSYPVLDNIDKKGWQAALGYIMGKAGSVLGAGGRYVGEVAGVATGDLVKNYLNSRQATKMIQGELPQYKQPVPVQSLLQSGAKAAQPFFGSITGDDMRRLGLLGQ